MALRTITVEALQQLARGRGGQCLSEEYLGVNEKHRWQCAQGHVFEKTVGSVKYGGNWCSKCSGKRKRTIEEMKEYAGRKGGDCLSDTYHGMNKRLKWKCSEGHVWETVPASVVTQDHWCPVCAGQRSTIEDMRELARKNGGECLSTEYVNTKTKLLWRCKSGHEFESPPLSIVQGRWCRQCYYDSKKSGLEEYHLIARKRGGRLLTKDYINATHKLRFQCAHGHVWETVPSSIKRGTWCPECAGIKQSLKKMREFAISKGGECLSTRYVDHRTKLKWRCSKGHVFMGRYLNMKYRKNFCPECRGHSLEEMKEVARKRGGECLSDEYVRCDVKLRWRCHLGHEWEATPVRVATQNAWCHECAGKKHTIVDMKKLAEDNGGRFLSTDFKNVNTKHSWECSEGHKFEKKPSAVKLGSWCPECSAKKRKGSIGEMKRLAISKGGKCISDKYINSTTKLSWQCDLGHLWDATPSSIKMGSWCPVCARILRRKPPKKKVFHYNITDMQTLAKPWGGRCLSKEYISEEDDLVWMCSMGHSWPAPPGTIRKGTWCPKCKRKRV